MPILGRDPGAGDLWQPAAGSTDPPGGGTLRIRNGGGRPPTGLHELGEDMLIWAFARAFNPAALRRHKLRRDRTELWISRDRLLQLHG